MLTLQDLKEAYLTQQNEAEAQAKAEDQAKEEQRRQTVDELKPRILDYLSKLENVTVDELNRGEFEGDWNDWDNTLARIKYTLSIPEHQPVSFAFYRNAATEKIGPASRAWNVPSSGKSPETLGEALVIASQVWQSQKAYQEEQEADSQSWLAHKAAQEEQEQREQDETRRMVEKIAGDPTAVLLLKLFAAIQAERGKATEYIAQLEEQYSNTVYQYDHDLSRANERAQGFRRQAEQSAESVRSLEYQVSDLESDLKKTKRQSTW